MLHDILGYDNIQWQPPLIRHFTKSWHCYQTRRYYRFWRHDLIQGVSKGYLEQVQLANRGCLLLRTPGPGSCPILDSHLFLCWDHSFWNCHVYGPFEFRTSLCTSILLCVATLLFGFSVGVGAFVIRLSQISYFSLTYWCEAWMWFLLHPHRSRRYIHKRTMFGSRRSYLFTFPSNIDSIFQLIRWGDTQQIKSYFEEVKISQIILWWHCPCPGMCKM